MKKKMPWLKARLTELGKTPTALAGALGIAGPRVYEMIGGRRHIQPDEIEPMAKFLEWTVEELSKRMPEAVYASKVDKDLQQIVEKEPVRWQHVLKDAVSADEVKDMILRQLVQHFEGRPIDWKVCEMGCALAAFEIKQAALFAPRIKTEG